MTHIDIAKHSIHPKRSIAPLPTSRADISELRLSIVSPSHRSRPIAGSERQPFREFRPNYTRRTNGRRSMRRPRSLWRRANRWARPATPLGWSGLAIIGTMGAAVPICISQYQKTRVLRLKPSSFDWKLCQSTTMSGAVIRKSIITFLVRIT